jgi:hypothetical protein
MNAVSISAHFLPLSSLKDASADGIHGISEESLRGDGRADQQLHAICSPQSIRQKPQPFPGVLVPTVFLKLPGFATVYRVL